ncbi:MAG: tetratricopeptide repeat protein [Planctomycetota bacterium]
MDLSKHLEKAEEASRRRNYALAIGLYHQILDLNPDYGEAREGLRKALDKKFEGKKGGGILALIQGFLPLLSARIARLTKNYQAQARNLERFLALAPASAEANLALGRALENGTWNKSAYVVYRHLGELVSGVGKSSTHVGKGGEAWRSAGRMATALKRFKEAMDCYEEALKLNPRDQESLRARKNLAAEGALEGGGYVTAKSSRELVRDKDALARIEKEQRIHQSSEEIQSDLERVEARLACAPEDPKLLRRVGELRAKAKDLGGALDCLERAMELEPDDFALLVQVGELRERELEERIRKARLLEDEDEARRLEDELTSRRMETMQQQVEAHPTDLALRFRLGQLFLDLDKSDEAIAEFQKAIKDPRFKIDALENLGRAFRSKGMIDLARSQFQKAYEAAGDSHKKSLDLLYQLGCIAEDQHRSEEARGFFSRILEVDIGFKDTAKKMEAMEAEPRESEGS